MGVLINNILEILTAFFIKIYNKISASVDASAIMRLADETTVVKQNAMVKVGEQYKLLVQGNVSISSSAKDIKLITTGAQITLFHGGNIDIQGQAIQFNGEEVHLNPSPEEKSESKSATKSEGGEGGEEGDGLLDGLMMLGMLALTRGRVKPKMGAKLSAKMPKAKKLSAQDTPAKVNTAPLVNNQYGVVQSRINLANKPTRFSPSKDAGFQHVLDRHFNPMKNAGQFSITPNELKSILQAKSTVRSPVHLMEQSGNYYRVIDVGKNIGTIKPSIPTVGGKPTSHMMVITDRAGNLVTTYPIPKP